MPGYQYRDTDGKFRNSSGYILTERGIGSAKTINLTIRTVKIPARPLAVIARTLLGPPPIERCECCAGHIFYAPMQVGEKITDLEYVRRGVAAHGQTAVDFEGMMRTRPHSSGCRVRSVSRIRFHSPGVEVNRIEREEMIDVLLHELLAEDDAA